MNEFKKEGFAVLYSEINFRSRQLFALKGSIEINCPPNKIWNLLTEPGHLKKIHPYCEYHEKVAYLGIGTKDTGRFASGKEVEREVIAWQPQQSYTVLLKDSRKKVTNITFSVEKINDETSCFSIYIATKAFKNVPRIIWKWIAKRKILPVMKKYLHSLLNGTKYYLETGEIVKPDQFGRLKGYSKK